MLWRLEHAVENGEVVVESFDKVRLEEDKAGYSQKSFPHALGVAGSISPRSWPVSLVQAWALVSQACAYLTSFPRWGFCKSITFVSSSP